jgi:hypothetical protein
MLSQIDHVLFDPTGTKMLISNRQYFSSKPYLSVYHICIIVKIHYKEVEFK